jgi:hypothetical protein
MRPSATGGCDESDPPSPQRNSRPGRTPPTAQQKHPWRLRCRPRPGEPRPSAATPSFVSRKRKRKTRRTRQCSRPRSHSRSPQHDGAERVVVAAARSLSLSMPSNLHSLCVAQAELAALPADRVRVCGGGEGKGRGVAVGSNLRTAGEKTSRRTKETHGLPHAARNTHTNPHAGRVHDDRRRLRPAADHPGGRAAQSDR